PAATARSEALHDEVLADVSLRHDEIVDVEAVVVLRVRHRRHDALPHVLRDALPGELQVGERRVDLLAADQSGNEVELARGDAQVARNRLRLVLGQRAFSLRLAHLTCPYPLSCRPSVRGRCAWA